MNVHCIVSGPWRENCYIVWNSNKSALIIDPGGEFSELARFIDEQRLAVKAVLNTHAHYDHLGAVQDVKERYNVGFYLHSADAKLLLSANFYRKLFLGEAMIRIPKVDFDLAECELLNFDDLKVRVLTTPGHTPGSVCFFIENLLFTGDTLLAKYIGRTDLPGGDRSVLLQSIERLLSVFPKSTLLYPGHGPSVTMDEALAHNSDFAELPQ